MLRRLLLGTVLAAGVVAPARAAEIDAVLPTETESVVYVNVRQVVDSKLVTKYALGQIKQTMAGNDEVQKLLKDLGVDPLKDIDKVTFGSWGKGPEDMQAVGVVRGKFDPAKLFAAAEAQAKTNADKVAIVKEGEYQLVKITVEKQPKPLYAAAVDEGMIVVGNDKKLVAKTLTGITAKAKPAVKKELAALLLKQDDKSSMYAVGLVDGKSIQLPPLDNLPGNLDSKKLGEQLANLKTMAIAVKLTEDVNLEVNMGMASADAADDFGATLDDLVGKLKGFLPLVSNQNPNFKPLADEVKKTLKSKVDKTDVTLVLKLTGDAIGKATGAAD